MPTPGPHDGRGNHGLWNPATGRDAPQDEDPLTAGAKVFNSTKQSTDAPSSGPTEGNRMTAYELEHPDKSEGTRGGWMR